MSKIRAIGVPLLLASGVVLGGAGTAWASEPVPVTAYTAVDEDADGGEDAAPADSGSAFAGPGFSGSSTSGSSGSFNTGSQEAGTGSSVEGLIGRFFRGVLTGS
ncbi:hypothetical protein ACWDYH_31560 [Nocardia goodfellowii]